LRSPEFKLQSHRKKKKKEFGSGGKDIKPTVLEDPSCEIGPFRSGRCGIWARDVKKGSPGREEVGSQRGNRM
jgi:hypothetical protein